MLELSVRTLGKFSIALCIMLCPEFGAAFWRVGDAVARGLSDCLSIQSSYVTDAHELLLGLLDCTAVTQMVQIEKGLKVNAHFKWATQGIRGA